MPLIFVDSAHRPAEDGPNPPSAARNAPAREMVRGAWAVRMRAGPPACSFWTSSSPWFGRQARLRSDGGREQDGRKERSDVVACIERQDVRDELVGPHDDQAAALAIDPAHVEDVAARLSVGAEHLLVVDQSK